MLKDLTQLDFQYFRSYADDMRKVQEREQFKYMDFNLLRAMYRGKTKYEDYENQVYGTGEEDQHLTALVTIFQSENTIIPTLYPQNPLPIVRPGRGSDADSAALMTSILKHYMKLNNAKRENQEAVLNARFFGLGWKKLGWQSVYPSKTQEPETQGVGENKKEGFSGVMGGIVDFAKGFLGGGQEMKPDELAFKERPELPDFETLYNGSESPMNIALDHKADFLNRKAILHSLTRTLHDLENSGDYSDPEGQAMLEELFDKLRSKYGSRFDSRKTELHLRELHLQQRNGIWICTWVDEFDKPLKYRKSDFQGKGFLFEPLSLTFEPGCRYPTSHIKVASQVQKRTDDLLSLFVELVARSVNLIAVNEERFKPGSGTTLEKNLIRGILKTKGPITSTDIQTFSSGSVGSDLPQLIGILQQKLSEILGGDAQLIFGQSKNETLGQDELARSGTNIREGGMKDRIKDWLIEQLKKESVLIKQYSNSELHVLVTGKDYADPITGEKVEDKWHSFMTESNPLGAKHYLQGEFEHDFNMEDNAIRPDKKSIREALISVLTLDADPAVQDANLQGGFRVRRDKVFVDLLETMDTIINPEEYIEKLDSQQVSAIQVQKLLMQSGGTLASTQNRQKAEVAIKKNGKSSNEGVSHPSSGMANE